MFLLKRLSDVCGWPATTYASLYYHGNWGGGGDVCKWRAGSLEKSARCVIAAMQQQTALLVCGDKAIRRIPQMVVSPRRFALHSSPYCVPRAASRALVLA